jgi:hypothetical protein
MCFAFLLAVFFLQVIIRVQNRKGKKCTRENKKKNKKRKTVAVLFFGVCFFFLCKARNCAQLYCIIQI